MPNNFRVKGAFFENDKQGPAFTGFVEIDGVRTNIALWPKTSQKGVNYFQVSEDKKNAPQATTAKAASSPFTRHPPKPANKPAPDNSDMDDDIPF